MRRRAAFADAGTVPPPAELLAPVVEEFVSAAEIGAHSFNPDCSACDHPGQNWRPSDCEWQLEMLGRRRWAATRMEWLTEHKVPRTERFRCWPASRPRWRGKSIEQRRRTKR